MLRYGNARSNQRIRLRVRGPILKVRSGQFPWSYSAPWDRNWRMAGNTLSCSALR